MKNSIIRSVVDAAVAAVGADLDLEALARLLQRLDELHRVDGCTLLSAVP